MTNIHNKIINRIGNKSVSIDSLYEFIKLTLCDSYEIGDAGVIIINIIDNGQLIVKEFAITRKS